MFWCVPPTDSIFFIYFCHRLPHCRTPFNVSLQVLMFRLLIQFTKGNPTLARRPVLVSALRESKKIFQVYDDAIRRCRAEHGPSFFDHFRFAWFWQFAFAGLSRLAVHLFVFAPFIPADALFGPFNRHLFQKFRCYVGGHIQYYARPRHIVLVLWWSLAANHMPRLGHISPVVGFHTPVSRLFYSRRQSLKVFGDVSFSRCRCF